MRNDAHDELENVPSLTAARDQDGPYPAPELEPIRRPAPDLRADEGRSRQKRRNVSTAPLWLMIVVLAVALGGLGWWSMQQIDRLEAQLVATQESFARISEDAAGRLQDISGKVVATESNVTTEGEALKLRIKQLEKQAQELAEQQRAITTQQQSLVGKQDNQQQRLEEQGRRVEAVSSEVRTQQASTAELAESLKGLDGEQATLKRAVSDLKGAVDSVPSLASRIEGMSKDIAALKQKGDPSQAVSRLEQDLLVLRSELDNRPTPTPGVNTGEFDAFRAQMTRSINTLQSQIANLQQQR
ncbi:ATPase [Stutzerimonas marianensis]|uniref:ATPase n=1 Tax=Stutzerimonas marianensis TaxID=2929513 RepID=A0A9X2ATK2_9GAMM|nr:ATPase [Pseudomonas marianensis]MCJ0974990.1 ATPase [Pseudomonas marianensis]